MTDFREAGPYLPVPLHPLAAPERSILKNFKSKIRYLGKIADLEDFRSNLSNYYVIKKSKETPKNAAELRRLLDKQ